MHALAGSVAGSLCLRFRCGFAFRYSFAVPPGDSVSADTP